MILGSRAELAGRVKLQISGGARGTIDYPWQDNMILDQGFEALIDGRISLTSYAFEHFSVGASSQPVSPTDTGCITPVYRFPFFPQNTSSSWDELGGYGWTRTSKTSARGAAAGNISELTCGWGNNNSSAFARTLVRDALGNPTTITVLPDEVLTITWELRRYWTPSDSNIIEYLVDGDIKTTTVNYKPVASFNKSNHGLGSGGVAGLSGSLISSSGGVFVGEIKSTFSESQGNPSVGSVSSPNVDSGVFPYDPAYATFDPPIAKTDEFRLEIRHRIALTRRNP